MLPLPPESAAPRPLGRHDTWSCDGWRCPDPSPSPGQPAAVHPGDPSDPASWSGYTELAQHVLATGPLGDDRPGSRRLLLDTAQHLQAAGDLQASRPVAEQLVDRWQRVLGSDHPDTLEAAAFLSSGLAYLNDLEAPALGQDTLDRCRRVLGPDHPTTVMTAATLILALARLGQEMESARSLGRDTLERAWRVLGATTPPP